MKSKAILKSITLALSTVAIGTTMISCSTELPEKPDFSKINYSGDDGDKAGADSSKAPKPGQTTEDQPNTALKIFTEWKPGQTLGNEVLSLQKVEILQIE